VAAALVALAKARSTNILGVHYFIVRESLTFDSRRILGCSRR
jgi:hypothetical protein